MHVINPLMLNAVHGLGVGGNMYETMPLGPNGMPQTFFLHNPFLLACGQVTSMPCDGIHSLVADSTYGLDLMSTNDALTFLRHILMQVLDYSADANEDWVSVAYNWISKSKSLVASQGNYVLKAIQDAITLCTIRDLMLTNWLHVHNHHAQQSVDKARRFKAQVIKAHQAHVTAGACMPSTETFRSCLGQTPSSLSTSLYSCNPWMEFTPNLCFVYIPSLQVLEVDLTLYTQSIPSSVSAMHGIKPCHLESLNVNEMNHCTEVTAFSHCMALLFIGEEDPITSAVKSVRFKVSAMTWARMLPDFHNSILSIVKQPEWHHLDIDDAILIHDLQVSCQLAGCMVPIIHSTLDICNKYIEVYRNLRDVVDGKSGSNEDTSRTGGDPFIHEVLQSKTRDLSQSWRSGGL